LGVRDAGDRHPPNQGCRQKPASTWDSLEAFSTVEIDIETRRIR
jgi:hypothetical protein